MLPGVSDAKAALTSGGLGYYRRARSLLEGAKVVVEKYGGELL
jgi:adenine-specific DNA glycosylase